MDSGLWNFPPDLKQYRHEIPWGLVKRPPDFRNQDWPGCWLYHDSILHVVHLKGIIFFAGEGPVVYIYISWILTVAHIWISSIYWTSKGTSKLMLAWLQTAIWGPRQKSFPSYLTRRSFSILPLSIKMIEHSLGIHLDLKDKLHKH